MSYRISYSQYVAYFKSLAINTPEIGHKDDERHFYRHDLSELNDKLSKVKSPFLALEAFSGTVEGGFDDLMQKTLGAFVVLAKINPGNNDLREQVLNSTKEIADKLIVKMVDDARLVVDPVRWLEPASFTWSKVGPVFDEAYGWRITFKLNSPFC